MNAHLHPTRKIGSVIKAGRKAKGLNQSELAAAIGASQGRVSQWEGDSDFPAGMSLIKLSAVLGIDFSEFANVDGAPTTVGTLGDAIRAARKAKDLGQADIADQLGVTVQAVSQWERNETMPSCINLLKLSGVLGIDMPGGRVSDYLAGLMHIPGQNKLTDLHEQLEEIVDLLHALDKIGDGIGGPDGYAVSAVALNAKSIADNALDTLKAMGAK